MTEDRAPHPWLDIGDLLDRLVESVTMYDREARLVYLNAAATRPFGRPREALLGQRLWDLVPSNGDRRTPFRLALEAVLAGGAMTTVTTFVAAFGRWYEVDIYPHPLGAFATARDVTEARRAQVDTARSEARFRAMVESSPEAIVIFDTSTGKFCDVNPATERLFGHTRAELLSMGPLDLVAPIQPGGADSSALVADAVERVMRGETVEMEWRALGAGGRTLIIELRACRLPSTDPVLMRGSLFDVTARKEAEARLAEIQRLEAVARLTGGVAHDFNNMITVITLGAGLAMTRLSADDRTRPDLENVLDAADRATLLTRQLLAFGRKQDGAPRVVDVGREVERLRPVLQRLVGEDIQVSVELPLGVGRVHIDPVQIEQVVVNLVANARDAMSDGGRIVVRAENVTESAAGDRATPARYVVITVSDSGEGIPEAIQAHIFEPFFTTKAIGRGTGLGLSTVRDIVTRAGGRVSVESPSGAGASFKVRLPHVDVPHDDAPPSAPAAALRLAGTETILLVEDDEGVRTSLRRGLQSGGYTVIEASHPGEALLACEQHADAIHLLVTDVVMPRMTGPELAARLRPARPGMRVVFVSGYGEERVLDAGRLARGHAFLSKPMSVEALLGCVRAELDRADD